MYVSRPGVVCLAGTTLCRRHSLLLCSLLADEYSEASLPVALAREHERIPWHVWCSTNMHVLELQCTSSTLAKPTNKIEYTQSIVRVINLVQRIKKMVMMVLHTVCTYQVVHTSYIGLHHLKD
jgi:hypothetical protein